MEIRYSVLSYSRCVWYINSVFFLEIEIIALLLRIDPSYEIYNQSLNLMTVNKIFKTAKSLIVKIDIFSKDQTSRMCYLQLRLKSFINGAETVGSAIYKTF